MYSITSRGELSHYVIGCVKRFRARDLKEFLASRRQVGTSCRESGCELNLGRPKPQSNYTFSAKPSRQTATGPSRKLSVPRVESRLSLTSIDPTTANMPQGVVPLLRPDSSPVPTNHGLRVDNGDRIKNRLEVSVQPHEKRTVSGSVALPRPGDLRHELLAQGKVFRLQNCLRFEAEAESKSKPNQQRDQRALAQASSKAGSVQWRFSAATSLTSHRGRKCWIGSVQWNNDHV